MTQPQNLFIPADVGEKVTLPGIEITIKVTSASTGNAFAVFEEVTSPGAGPALHVHRHQFEIFHIPPDLVVVQWTSDGESGSYRDFLFRQDVWTMFRRQISEKI